MKQNNILPKTSYDEQLDTFSGLTGNPLNKREY